jgi:hypothetical protein
MAILKDSGDAAKGDQRGRKGGIKGLTYFPHQLKKFFVNLIGIVQPNFQWLLKWSQFAVIIF